MSGNSVDVVNDFNSFGTDSTLVIRNENEEWEAYYKLHPSVRQMLQDCPYEFSAIDAAHLWKMCVATDDSLAEFEFQLNMNVDNIRKAEKRIGVGNDISATQSVRWRRMVINGTMQTEDSDPPDAFHLY